MKYIKLYENFLFELKKYQSGKISIITDISQLPKVGVPVNKSEFERDGIVAIDWDKIVCVRSSDELPSISGKNLVCHTGRALKTTGFNKSFEDYLKKKYNEKDNPDNQYLRHDPNYKDFETFKKCMLEEHYVRWTKHFTLNHIVSSHSSGSWSGNKYVYLTPGEEMIKVNGTPANLYAIDTYWNKSIVLTDNTVVLYHKSAKSEVEEFIGSIKETRNIIYFLEVGTKKDTFGEKLDIDSAIEAMGYSVFSGGTHYSVQDHLDDEIRDLKDKEGIKMGSLHWGGKYDKFEDGYITDENIFNYVPRIYYEDYYNFGDNIIKREEKEYQSHRGFMKEALELFKKDYLTSDYDKILINTTKIARAISTPKYAYYERDQGNGLSYNDSFDKKIDLLNWDIKKLESQLKPQEEQGLRYSQPGMLKKDLVRNEGCIYLYFNKYLLNDLKIIFSSTTFYKGLEENKNEILKLSEILEKHKSNSSTDDEAKELEKLLKLPKFEKFHDHLESLSSGNHPGDHTFVDFFANLNKGAKKYGFKDFFDMFSI